MAKRSFLLALLLSSTLSLNAQSRVDSAVVSDRMILHVLNRLTFGARPADVETVHRMGLQAWIQSQLHPEEIEETLTLERKLEALKSLRMSLSESLETNGGMGSAFIQFVDTNGTVKMSPPRRSPEMDLKDGKLYRAVYSNRQLEEVLVDFWFNHFNVLATKARPFAAHYEREAIRPFVLGSFRDMLFATALHPAMMLYLDNKESIAPEVAKPGPNMTVHLGSARGLNENFSRELMELHTLGVNGGYTQRDIEAAARAFSGWRLVQTSANLVRKEPAKIELLFYAWAHDPNDKIVLGQKIEADGYNEVYKLLDILADHPSTARHISFRLAQRFVADDPPQSLVERMTKTFMDTGGDLREVMTTLVTSPEFLSDATFENKLKSPLEMAVGAVRAIGAEVAIPAGLANPIADMGQPLYGKLEPDGYPNTGKGWFGTASLLARLNFATDLPEGNVHGATVDPSRWKGKDAVSLAREILGRDPTPELVAALRKANVANDKTPEFIVGLILGSPDFQRK